MTQDRPEAAELLEAVAGFLFSDVREWAPAEKRFLVLVAANLCAVVARELRAGEQPLREDLELFSALLGNPADPSLSGEELRASTRSAQLELAGRIREGRFDDRLDELSESLREHVRRQLEIARPGYDRRPG